MVFQEMTQAVDCQCDEDAAKADWDGRYSCAARITLI